MNQTKYYNSKLKFIGLLLISTTFVAIGALMVISGDEVLMGWLCGGFFALGIPIFLRQIFDFNPRLILSDDGVIDSTLGIGKILWKDVNGLSIKSVHKNDFICLEMDQDANEKYLSNLSSVKRKLVTANVALGFEPVNLNLSGIKGSTNDIFNTMLMHLEQVSKINQGDA